ncbi:MAG TPA: hypothetical protein VGC97_23130 [Pyrinomonadaceae bacterium]
MKSRIFLMLWLAMSGGVSAASAQDGNLAAEKANFEKARINAKEILPAEIRPVIAVTPKNLAIDWIADKVKVVSFMSMNDCRNYEAGKKVDFGGNWVTASPELKKRYEQNKSEFGATDAAKLLRIRQLIGLHPENKYDCFVEIALDPKYLWRPSFNNSVESDKLLFIPTAFDDKYQDYFLRYFKKWLTGSDPFTALGYTCDWKNGECDYGLSEFVVKPEGSGKVVNVYKGANTYLN